MAYLGTNDFKKVYERASEGEEKASQVIEAAVYQICKEIGAMAAVLEGKVDAIILTGGMAYEKDFTKRISLKVSFISDVYVYPGEDEIKSLAFNGLLALDDKIKIGTYS